jgi:hypothetical protein
MQRAPRYKPTHRGVGRHGERVTGTPAQLAILALLADYPCLPSKYIRAALPGSVDDRLLQLKDNDYIGVPVESTMHASALYRSTVYELRPKGAALLARSGRIAASRRNEQFRHKFLASLIRYSFDAAAREVPGLRVRTVEDILAHPNCPQATRGEKNPSEIPMQGATIRPDAPLFGYEYAKPDGAKRYLYLHGFEADRGTEPLTGKERQTIEGKISQYARYLRARGYRSRYGLSNCAVAFVTIGPLRAANIVELIRSKAGDAAPKFLVKSVPDFIHESRFPPPTGHMATEDWATTNGPFNILATLKGAHDVRREEGGAGERAGADH